jgi:adenine nucleotide transporter 17
MDQVLGQVFSTASLVHALSGLLGGSLAMSIVYPLDQLRLLAQLASMEEEKQKADDSPAGAPLPPANAGMVDRARWLVKHKGAGELYRGIYATLITTGSANFIYFYMYNGFKLATQVRTGLPTVGPIMNLVVATCASFINVVTTNPLWVCATKVKADSDGVYGGSIIRCMRRVVKEGGMSALMTGIGPSLWLMTNPVVQYFTYERLRILATMLHGRFSGGSPLGLLDFFVVGACAKACATVATYPLQISQSLCLKTGKGMLTCIGDVVRRRGRVGLWLGMGAKLTQTVLNAALMFMFYEKIQPHLLARVLNAH